VTIADIELRSVMLDRKDNRIARTYLLNVEISPVGAPGRYRSSSGSPV
jgi:hypothetical protein